MASERGMTKSSSGTGAPSAAGSSSANSKALEAPSYIFKGYSQVFTLAHRIVEPKQTHRQVGVEPSPGRPQVTGLTKSSSEIYCRGRGMTKSSSKFHIELKDYQIFIGDRGAFRGRPVRLVLVREHCSELLPRYLAHLHGGVGSLILLIYFHPQRLVSCGTTSASTAPCTSRKMRCPAQCASYHAPCQPQVFEDVARRSVLA